MKCYWPQRQTFVLAAALLTCCLLWAGAPLRHADAALYWQQGVHDATISVCFVGNALTTRPARVTEILGHLKEFEYAANIDFVYLGKCATSLTLPGGNAYYDGDIRVVIPAINVNALGPVPGTGCPMFEQQTLSGYNGDNDTWQSWSNSPADLGLNRSCLYNLKLGDDPWNDTPYLNHTLHEFGHALGLSHEHERLDATCYDPNDDARWVTDGYMTPYDVNSLMHYKFSIADGHTCDTAGNYDRDGFSTYDKLALHILYPEDTRVAEIVGRRVIQAGETLQLQSAWQAAGANMAFVAKNYVWRLSSIPVAFGPTFTMQLNTPGVYLVQFAYDDFLDRHYSGSYTIRVLTPAAYAAQIAQIAAVNSEMLTTAANPQIPSAVAVRQVALFLGTAPGVALVLSCSILLTGLFVLLRRHARRKA